MVLLFHDTATATFQAAYVQKDRQPASAFLLGFRYHDWSSKYPVWVRLSEKLIVSGLQSIENEIAVPVALDVRDFGSALQNSHDNARNWSTRRIGEPSAHASNWLESQLSGASHFRPQLVGREKNSGEDCRKEESLSFHKPPSSKYHYPASARFSESAAPNRERQ